ncbi:DUF5302 family protein [Nocardioides donggukensis]|uniref:DUF5302 family protein n=1 Tax=Nocardioides donggukensis TaxID=2774019 RepID=A0A927K9I0_9ACTN|nr:DUF5302 family protein [Nocardioides donggukensis]MBD8870251.1 DUF5302 family protein [Nocardioides donggukensis]
MTDASESNADLKARMREALDRKNRASHPTEGDVESHGGHGPHGAPGAEKAHGPEVAGGAAPKMHRRKAGGGGS